MNTEPSKRRATVYSEPIEVVAELRKLGVTREILETALKQGEAQRRLGSNLDPKPSPAYNAWARTVRVLREGVLDLGTGWHPEEPSGIPMIANADETVALAVSSGDENTGRPETGTDPATRNAKGEATAIVVAHNVQESLDIPAPTTWVLLYDSALDGLFAELSCPESLAANGYIDSWSERIVLGQIDLGEAEKRSDAPVEPPADAPDVQVVRRTS